MMKRTRRKHSSAVKGEQALAGLAHPFNVRPNQVTEWKGQLQECATSPPQILQRPCSTKSLRSVRPLKSTIVVTSRHRVHQTLAKSNCCLREVIVFQSARAAA
ncbi:hypothetical protein SAMN04487769_2544 [Burkholderia sp. b14]|nr:hypothetical protein SAMN04487769_2544 [Burkholderia sp. b14]